MHKTYAGFFKILFRSVFIGKNPKKMGQKQEKFYSTSKILQFFAKKMRTEKNYGNSRITFLDIDVRNISAKLQIIKFSSF